MHPTSLYVFQFYSLQHQKITYHSLKNYLLLSVFFILPSAALTKPLLTISPAQAVDGSSVSLTCGAVNHDVTKYEFFKGTTMISNSTSTNKYTIKAVTFSGAGTYSCKIYKESFPTSSDQKTLKGNLLY